MAEQVEKYQNRLQEPEPLAETKPCARPTTTRTYTSSLFKTRVKIGEEFREFCQTHKIEVQAKPFKPPHGFVDLFIKQRSLIKGLATDEKSKKYSILGDALFVHGCGQSDRVTDNLHA